MFPWVQSQIKRRKGLIYYSSQSHMALLKHNIRRDSATVLNPPPPPTSLLSPPPSTSSGKISPAVLFIIVILAIVFFISGLLHLLVRFFLKHRSTPSFSHSSGFLENSSSDTYQRQLQQLFTLHDSGLDQAFIDALPVFQYEEIVGSKKEQFDCAVCLCEFSDKDKLRLLPLCSHAFHIDCIDTWLLSNSTCPICRGALYTPGLPIENPVFDFDDSREEDDGGGLSISAGVGGSGRVNTVVGQKPSDPDGTGDQRRVFPVRLGKFRSTNNEGQGGETEVGETSSSNLDARRCFSMGSYQYVVAESELQVAVSSQRISNGGDLRMVKERGGHSSINRDTEGKRINIGSKNESFSVSKVWLWRNKGKFPNSSNVHMGDDNSSVPMKLPWTNNNRPFGT